MDQAEHISVAKDDKLIEALEHVAALNEPGTSETELLRYLARRHYDRLAEVLHFRSAWLAPAGSLE